MFTGIQSEDVSSVVMLFIDDGNMMFENAVRIQKSDDAV